MADIKINGSGAGGDIDLAGAILQADDGLATAVILSLFLDRRAEADDPLDGQADRRGWWADAFPAVSGDQIGSRLWLLRREKQTPEVLTRAREYAEEALRWLVDDGVAARIAVSTAIVRTGVLGIVAEIHRPDGAAQSFTFSLLWENT
jgi:phage gp46-like protein